MSLKNDLTELFTTWDDVPRYLMNSDWALEVTKWDDEESTAPKNFATEKGIFDPTEVDSYGGEGCGEVYYSIYKFENRDHEVAYVKFEGSYYSYDGATFDSWFFVNPVEVMVTQYHRE